MRAKRDTHGFGNSYYFALNLAGLMEALSQTAGHIDMYKKQQKGKISDGGLGPFVLAEGQGILLFWQRALGSSGAEEVNTPKTRALLGKDTSNTYCCDCAQRVCRILFAQISQMSRLRGVYFEAERDVTSIAGEIRTVVKSVEEDGDSWLKPIWWTNQCDLGLMTGLVEKGWDR